MRIFFFQAEDGIRGRLVTGFRRVSSDLDMMEVQNGVPLLTVRVDLAGNLVSHPQSSRPKRAVDAADEWRERAVGGVPVLILTNSPLLILLEAIGRPSWSDSV